MVVQSSCLPLACLWWGGFFFTDSALTYQMAPARTLGLRWYISTVVLMLNNEKCDCWRPQREMHCWEGNVPDY
jgi:hypothetical protein